MKFLYNILKVLLLVSLGWATAQDELSSVVTVEQGQVQGNIMYTIEGREFYAYRGIPFAKPPLGPLRFKPPEPAEAWSGVFSATSDPPLCIQPSSYTHNVTGVEDCLYLDVYTPLLPTNTSNPSLTVHVFVHGGSFYCEGIRFFNLDPKRYMNLDLVVVTLQYRLGALGFLATDDEAASGNWGLLDQNLALKWVQKNIAAFGGNPNDVTLSGQSAGGASVLYHYLSPMSAGLFNRVISQSGSPINGWALQEHPLDIAIQMGEHFNCTTDNHTELIECLRGVDAIDITAENNKLMVRNLMLTFVPNVETSSSGLFLTEDPYKTFETGNFNQVPLQLGFNRDEGDMIFRYIPFLFINITDITFDLVIPVILSAITDYRTNLINVSYAIKDEYYAGVDYENQTEVNIVTIKWISDGLMKSGVAKTAALVSSHNIPTYFYEYEYVSSWSLENYTGEPDVMHHTEMQYLWYRNTTDPDDAEFGSRFFQLWVDFILHNRQSVGSDDPWLPTPPGQYNFYDINQKFTMRGNYDTEHMEFWWNTVPAIVNA